MNDGFLRKNPWFGPIFQPRLMTSEGPSHLWSRVSPRPRAAPAVHAEVEALVPRPGFQEAVVDLHGPVLRGGGQEQPPEWENMGKPEQNTGKL